MLALELSLTCAFLAVAYWLDRENRRVTSENASLRSALADAKQEATDALERCVELDDELQAYREEESSRVRAGMH